MALTDRQLNAICDSLSSGTSLRATCTKMNLPESTVRRWIRDCPEAASSVIRARELGFDSMADQCIEIADAGDLEPQDRRVRIETRIRLLGKWSQRYADRQSVDVGNKPGETLRVDAAVDNVSLVLHLAEALRQQKLIG